VGSYYRWPWTLNHPDFLAVDFNPFDPAKITVGSDAGIFRSDDLGNSWTSCNQNLGGFALLHGLASSTYDANFVEGGLHDYGFGYNPTAGPMGSTFWYSIEEGSDGGNMTASPFKSKHFIGNKLMGHQPILYSNSGTGFLPAADYDYEHYGTVEHSPFTHHPTEPGVVYTARFNSWFNPQQVQFRKSTNYGANWGGDATPLRQFERPNNWDATAPFFIAVSQSNPNTMIMDFGNLSDFWLSHYDAKSRLVKSTNGGLNWFNEQIPGHGIEAIIEGGDGHGIPNRSFTDVEFDPNDESLVYLTVSGFYYPSTNQGHVFKSTDGGYNWSSISGSLPDIPVSDFIIHYKGSGSNDKELIIATDAGIYASNEESIDWKELAGGFPNTTALHLDYNRLSGKLRANTWGRGAWEYQLDNNTIYVQDNLYITDNVTIDKDIVVCPGGKVILGYANFPSINISFASGKKIMVQDGGTLDASSGDAITLTSQSSWGGIEFQGSGYGTLNNVTFNNTNSPIVINGYGSAGNEILINNCHFNDGQVLIDSRDNVSIFYSDFNFTNFGKDNSAIFINGSEDIDIQHNSITFNNNLSGATGIAANYSTVYISDNTIHKSYTGISASNSNAGIGDNTIDNTNGNPDYAYIGIELVNCYSSGLKRNSVTGYQRGIYMYYSSPQMLQNSFTNSNTAGDEVDALHADYASWPILYPSYQGDEVIIDGGYNTLSTTSEGNGIKMTVQSWPLTDYGYNVIYGYDNYITGYVGPEPWPYYYARCNDWTEEPNPNKFTIEEVEVVYEPYIPNCEAQGGGKAGEIRRTAPDLIGGDPEVPPAEAAVNPPTYMIVDRGYGHYDTLLVRSSSTQLPQDQMLFMQANKEELLGNIPNAISKYKQVIVNYPDSLSALNSLRRIIMCVDRLSTDTSRYSQLREYCLNLAQLRNTDTAFCNVVKELAAKTLVRKTKYPQAISEYENIIESSTDTSQILCAELNIIQTYMLIHTRGDAPSFTGKLTKLKPGSIIDGYRKMQQLLHGNLKGKVHKVIPKEFKLAQNYPNPFNPLTTIEYALPQNTKVTIKVYDILGRLVKELVNEYKEAGYYKIKFDGSNFASGVYLYRVEAGTFVATKKMVLVK
jgi:hypothetical protein